MDDGGCRPGSRSCLRDSGALCGPGWARGRSGRCRTGNVIGCSPGDVRRLDGATTFATIRSCLQTSANTGRTSSPSSTSSSPDDLGCHQHRRLDRNAHARRTTDKGDCARVQRISGLCSGGARNRACVCRCGSCSCRLVMRRWTRTAGQTQIGRTNGKEFSMGFRRRALVAGAVGGAALVHHERRNVGESGIDLSSIFWQSGMPDRPHSVSAAC